MKISIDNTQTTKALQSEFSKIYPFLKIEFFSQPHKTGHGTNKRFLRQGDLVIGSLRTSMAIGHLEIREDMTVAELEKLFADQYGLYVQVFRRSGKLWLETTATDQWTLAYQNEQGRELSNGSLADEKENTDYHEQL